MRCGSALERPHRRAERREAGSPLPRVRAATSPHDDADPRLALLEHGGNDVVTTSRLLRHSAGGKNTSIAQRHYIGKSHHFLRDAVDDAFAPYAGMIAGGGVVTVFEAPEVKPIAAAR